VIEPGVVMIERAKNYLTLGEPDGTISTRARRLAAAVEAGGNMTVEVTGDIRTAIWNKLISNLSSGPMSVLAMATYRDVFTQPACRAAALRIMQEAAAVARALGCSPETDHAARLALTQNLPHRPSVLQDLELGRPMEVESLMGTTLELARIAGVETPTLDLLVALVQVRAQCAGLYAPAGASPAPASH